MTHLDAREVGDGKGGWWERQPQASLLIDASSWPGRVVVSPQTALSKWGREASSLVRGELNLTLAFVQMGREAKDNPYSYFLLFQNVWTGT